MCSPWPHHVHSPSVSSHEECAMVSPSHMPHFTLPTTHPPMWRGWGGWVHRCPVVTVCWVCFCFLGHVHITQSSKHQMLPWILILMCVSFMKDGFLTMLVMAFLCMVTYVWMGCGCAWVRTSDSSQRTTFHCWIKGLMHARYVVQGVFPCYPMRSTQEIKRFLISTMI